MNTYSWPANVLMTEKGVVLGFPEWPDLAPVGDTVQEAMLAATTALSAAVSSRIEAGATIPAPSDHGPRQIPIVIDGETAARVDAYVEIRESERLRQRSEMEQVNRDRRAAFLTEFRVNLDPIERIRDTADSGATEFALVGVRSCYLLNGGGLVAIPAIMQILSKTQLPGSLVLWPALVFVLGILFSAITNYFAYRSMFTASEAWGFELNARASEVSGTYYPQEDEAAHKGKIAQNRIDQERKLTSARRCADIGVITFGGAIICFLVGVGLAIHGLGAPAAG